MLLLFATTNVMAQKPLPHFPLQMNAAEMQGGLSRMDMPKLPNQKKTIPRKAAGVNFTEKLDSVVCSGKSKSVYKYDNDGMVVLETHHNWNSTDKKWVNDSKNEYAFDEWGNQILSISYGWNSDLNDWEGRTKAEKTFWNKDYCTYSAQYTWDSSLNDWRCDDKSETSYDEKGNVVSDADYQWDNVTNSLQCYSKVERTYNEEGKTSQSVTYHWNRVSCDWDINKCNYTYSYDYDAAGKVSSEYIETSYPDDASKNYKTRIDYTYNENDEVIKRLVYTYNSWSYNWDNSEKDEYSYWNGETSRVAYYSWDKSLGKWIGIYKYDSDYNEKGLITFYAICYSWNYNKNDWRCDSKSEFAYDENGNMTSNISYFTPWNSDTMQKSSEYVYTYDYASSGEAVAGLQQSPNKLISHTIIGSDETYTYYYSSFQPTAIKEIEGKAAEGEGAIYTLDGQEVKTMMPNRVYIKNGKKFLAK